VEGVVPTGARGDSEEAFRRLYESNASRIFAFLCRSGLDRSDAEEVAAEVFLVAWRRIQDLPDSPEDRLWLYGVARNLAAKERGRRWRGTELVRRIAHNWSDQDDASDHQQSRLKSAIAMLPANERDVVQLIIWEQLSHDECARILGCSPNASRIRFHKAKQRLSRWLPELHNELEGQSQLGNSDSEVLE